MQKLMLTLLTYEPYEKVSQAEKEYIDGVLNEQPVNESSDYHQLFYGFYLYLGGDNQEDIKTKDISWEKLDWLRGWKTRYMRKSRVYPVLFKKICFYSIVNSGMSDKAFLSKINMRENILEKWGLSARYRKAVTDDTYYSLKIQRNGRKVKYLTDIIKAVYYEAGRQNNNSNRMPKKQELPVFVDVFAGTGTVAASVNADRKILNDKDIGVACFLYTMSSDPREFKRRIIKLHNDFVSKDLFRRKFYTADDYIKHYPYFVQKNIEVSHEYWEKKEFSIVQQIWGCYMACKFQDFIIRIRNNYGYINDCIQKIKNSSSVNFKYKCKHNLNDVYDIGVKWFFINAIEANFNNGNQFSVTNIDDQAYIKYLTDCLGIKFKRSKKSIVSDLRDLKLRPGKIKLKGKNKKSGYDFMENIHNSVVLNQDFRQIIKGCKKHSDRKFLYLDSPYFLTTDYDIPFQDKEHKQMLDLLRNSSFKWLFSMKCMDWATFKSKNESQRRSSGQRRIMNYLTYYKGFVRKFDIDLEKNLYVQNVPAQKLPKNADNLYIILFNKNYDEMMICNFDIRRAIPYNEDGAVIMPFREFLLYIEREPTKSRDDYFIRKEALTWRKKQIIEKYATGEWI